MKKVAIISTAPNVCKEIYNQIEALIGDEVEVKWYCLEDDIPKRFDNTLIVFTGPAIKKLTISKMFIPNNYIVARRVVNYHYLSSLISLPTGTEVLLVNDFKETCIEAIDQLRNLGIDHVKYYPYYPGTLNYKKLELAVTPGESNLVPNCVKKIIDIGIRKIDITTINEILKDLDLMKSKGNIVSSQFVRDIVDLSKRYNHATNRSIELKNMFQIIVDNSIDGIVYLNNSGEITAVNKAFESLTKIEKKKIINKNISDVLPELGKWKTVELDRDMVKINGRNVAVVKVPVKRHGNIVGYLITIEDVAEIQKLEYEMRRKMRDKKHNARYHFSDIVSKSDAMKKTISLAKKFSLSNSPILIQGENGTGKELFAQSIHIFSNKKNKPFIPVNFAALSSSLLESELFGYEGGAFTGAKKGGKAGLFEEAHSGTIFLDEIGDAPLEFQARLLRVLQEKQVRRVGSTQLIPIDVRVIAATNKDLKLLVKEGKFRQDLFYRLNVLPIYVPPLRERKEDIVLLIDKYLKKFTNDINICCGKIFSKAAIEYLIDYEWPGNIRELVNVVEYIVNVKIKGKLIDISELPPYVMNDCIVENIPSLKQFYDENIIWILEKIRDKKNAGRRTLAKLAHEEHKELTEAKIKTLLKKMQHEELIDINIGVKGNTITKKGIQLLLSFKGY